MQSQDSKISTGQAAASPPCKICGAETRTIFSLPRSKRIGTVIPELADDCAHFRCSNCGFVFNDVLSDGDARALYSAQYWDEHVAQTRIAPILGMRLLALASRVLGRPIEDADILDFGCGQGSFMEEARRELGLRVWGTDINPPTFGEAHFLRDLGDRRFDIIIAAEVVEHLPEPREAFQSIFDHLTPSGVFCFQTACWDDRTCGRDWWYLGPAHGHVSFYSAASLDWLADHLGVSRRATWGGYPGVQAWVKGDGLSRTWYARFVEAADLSVRNGARRDGEWIIDDGAGSLGTIVHGPYWTLDPGRYRASVAGHIEGTYQLRATAGSGRVTLGGGEVRAQSPAIEFSVAERATEFECVITRQRASRGLRLERLVLHRMADTALRVGRGWRAWFDRR